MKTAFLCSGQGSQYVGMTKDIYENSETGARLINRADEILGYKLSEICFNGPAEVLKETRHTQPALFLHSALVYELIKEFVKADAVAGHSVGEYAALFAAGALSFEDALKLVSLRGELMFKAGEKNPGTMLAVIGLDDKTTESICEEISKPEEGLYAVAANYNCPGQLVVSGSAELLRENAKKFKEAGAKLVKELAVSGAFHSPLMEDAKNELAAAIESVKFNDALIPVYANVSARAITRADEIKSSLIAQLTSPVLWTQTLINMRNDGIKKYVEIGAGKVLQGLTKRTLTDAIIEGVDTFSDISAYFDN